MVTIDISVTVVWAASSPKKLNSGLQYLEIL